MRMNDERGRSLCKPGEELWALLANPPGPENVIRYDYRTDGGTLFSCCAPTLEVARARRDRWRGLGELRGVKS